MPKPGLAAQWLRDNDPKHKRHRDFRKLDRANQKAAASTKVREYRIGMLEGREDLYAWRAGGKATVREFVETAQAYTGNDCLFVPGAQRNRPATVSRFGKKISAARYMLLLAQGTPPSDGMQARHKCGNGHLSCVNPAHLEWGTPGDNIGDANIHRAMEGATVEDKCRAVDARTSK